VDAILVPMTTIAVAEVVGERYPDWAVESVEYLGEGDVCVAYVVDHRWVFRFARDAAAIAALRRESCFLSHVADRFDLRVPVPHDVRLDASPAFVAHRLLPGPALTTERYQALEEPDREHCARQLARFAGQVHEIELQTARSCGLEVIDPRAYLARVLADAQAHLFKELAPRDQAFVESQASAYLACIDASEDGPAVLHGDLSPDHVLFDPASRSVSALIDFSDVVIGDPAWDVVYLYEDYGPDFVRRFFGAHDAPPPRLFLERVHRLAALEAVQWALRCARGRSPEFTDAVTELTRMRIDGERRLEELLSACAGP